MTRGGGKIRRALLGSIWIVLAWQLVSAGPAGASEWRTFGIEDFSGYLAFKSESSSKELRGVASGRQTMEEIARLRLSSYVLHPRFLSLTADAAFALNSGVEDEGRLRNRDSSLSFDLLRENPLTIGGTVQAKTEELHDQDFNHYERRTAGYATQGTFRGERLSVAMKFEDSDIASDSLLPEAREDARNRVLSVNAAWRPDESSATSLSGLAVTRDDRLVAAESILYRSVDLSSALQLSAGRGNLDLAASSWQAERPYAENRLSLREQWTMRWSPRLSTNEEAEFTQRTQSGIDYTSYHVSAGASQSLSTRWQFGGQVSASGHQASSREENSVQRAAATAAYASRWGDYQVGLGETLGLTRIVAGPSRIIRIWEEPHQLSTDGAAQQLAFPNVRLDSVQIKDKLTHALWNSRCTITQSGTLTYIAWKVGTPAPPGYEDQTNLDVEVDYDYELSTAAGTTSSTELNNALNLRASRKIGEGVTVDSTLLVNSRTLPAGQAENRYEAGLQTTLKPAWGEVVAGGALAKERNAVFARGTAYRFGWQFSESYQAEFFPNFTGHRLQSRMSRLWGLAAKTHVGVELGDETYFSDGQLAQGILSAKIKATRLFNPFMRIEVEGEAKTNRALPDDAKLYLDTRYVWRQGQLDLIAGYEFTRRTYDRFLDHRIYITLIRAL